jgi:pyrroloquinoline quinone (PQQ) biosynthesis protein C
MSFFIALLEATDASRRELEMVPRVERMLHHGLSRLEYLDFLRDLYHIVWHFCPIMAAAASRCGDEFSQVRRHLYRNIEEEQGHERFVLEDIGAVGGDPESTKSILPSLPAQALIAYNYHASERIHPCAVIGMLYALEIISSVYGAQAASAISESLGMTDAQGFGFLNSHASMDQHHMARLNELVKTISDPVAQGVITNTVRLNFWLFGQLFRA